MQTNERWIGVAAAAELRQAGYQRIVDASSRAIESRGEFVIVLSGGNTPRDIYTMLRAAATDWSKWRVYFGDERCLPPEDAERNSRMAGAAWLDHAPVPPRPTRSQCSTHPSWRLRAWRAGSGIPARAIQPPAGVDVLVESTLIIA